MRRAAAIAVCALCALIPFADLAGCTSDDNTGPGGEDAGGYDATTPELDGTASDTSAPDTSVPDANVADTSVAETSLSDSNAPDAALEAGDDGAADAGLGAIRVANLSPGGAAVDFCFAPTSSAYGSPYMKGVGVSAGIAYGSVSEYAGAAPSATGYSIRIVAAGATTCTTSLSGVADVSIPTPTATNPATIALVGVAGDGTAPLTLLPLVDESAATAPAAGLRIRIVHAAPHQPATDFELGAGAWTFALQTGVAYGKASSASTMATGAPTPDANGYLTTTIDSAQITAKQSLSEIASSYDDEFRTGSAFFVGNGSSAPLGTVQCDDTSAPSAHLSPCTLRTGGPTFHKIRFLHLAPDAPVADVCLSMSPIVPVGTTGLLAAAGVAGGESFLQLSGPIVTYPDVTSFDAFFMAVGGNCSTAIGATSIGSSLQAYDGTVTLLESTFGATPAYTLYFTLGDFIDTGDPSTANLAIANDDDVTGAETIDVYDAPDGGSATSLWSAVGPRDTSFFANLTPGTYGFTVEDHTTSSVLFATTGVSLTAGASVGLHFFDVSATTKSLARCNLAAPDAGLVTTCVQ